MTTQAPTVEQKLKKIREAYVKQLPAQLETIRSAYNQCIIEEQDSQKLEELHRRIHTMKGACASFRLSNLSVAAAAGERLVKEVLRAAPPSEMSWQQQLLEIFDRMECAIAAIDVSQGMELPIHEPVAVVLSPERERKLIYLCEDDSFQRQTIEAQITCFGFDVVSFEEVEKLPIAVQGSPPDAIVMDMIFPGMPTGGADIMDKINSGREKPIPVVFISSNSSLSNRLSAVRAGSSGYFTKPVNINDLCSTLARLTATIKPEPYRIMIVDDDPQLAAYHSLILQEAGMATLTVSDPLQTMSPLLEFKPDLILMDMYMPGCNGMELAKAIRQINTFFSIPIVYLSSETDMEKQVQALRIGGDEFLTKPIKPEHLISTVAVRAERMKIIRSHMLRDSMTGLYNHTTTKEQLDSAIARARRNNEEVCFAMIDLDKFKMVNDTYGHPAGDLVLITLAGLIRQQVRKTDIVGRFGGEEFAVILPDCTLSNAVTLMNELLSNFSAVSFQSKDKQFFCTFSCGIAPLSLFGDAAAICMAADEALYAAKNGGRNRICVAKGADQVDDTLTLE